MTDSLGRDFLGALFRLKSLLGSEFGNGGTRKKNHVNMPEYILLREIADNAIGADTNTELTDIREFLSISKPAVSQMLASLEKKGYITREINPENRKYLVVTLTPQGRKILQEIDDVYTCRFQQITEAMGEQDIKEMIRLIDRLNGTVNMLNNMEGKQ
jgi:DNA-binding MarR family transcriptional regulator